MKVVSILLTAMLASLLSLSQSKPAVTLEPFPFERVEINCQSQGCHYDGNHYCTARHGRVSGHCALKQAVCQLNDKQISCVVYVPGEN